MREQEPNDPSDPEAQSHVDHHEAAPQVAVSKGDSQRQPLLVQQGLDTWELLIAKATRLLSETNIDGSWVASFTELTRDVRELARRNVDLALYVLIQSNGSGVGHYSAQHSMICLVMAELAADWMDWPAEEKQALALAALSMNVSITTLQDSLAKQSFSLSDRQRELINVHSAASVDLLTKAGVAEPVWLYVVQHHHLVLDPEDGGDAKTGPRLAELLRRVDIYTAKLSRRVSRESVTPAMAARDACLGASGHPDGIGATLLKVVGLYPPGTFVELANGETAVVIKRGEKAHTPIVASLRREDGGLLTQPERRDTLRAGLTVRKGVEPSRVRVSFDHRRVLACVAASSVRP
ncbi:HD-GYP domain-containing protein [Rhodoferax antarcticus]|uniref:Metal dependent phosphohydrolase n=1 Tax=Rhodoferax antarcticus ANT.BR TaxID=1111071 RepID=A0A1Q8YKQ4_9BURK|nr:hypothetical protein [Rhodoferax antarcticus]APW47371.1 hypothetical protein RA876_14545 [Rhodoferax antarcticus]OLP08480.1 hypothetical protein BLL52_0086 [Rhodoferax antarcticus ANT.BR]